MSDFIPPIIEQTPPPILPESKKVLNTVLCFMALIALVVLGIVLFNTLNTKSDSTAKHKVNYSVIVNEKCSHVEPGFDDINVGTTVEVFDGSDNLLGFGDITKYEIVNKSQTLSQCLFTAKVFSIKKSSDGIYRITSGNQNRGFLDFRESDFHNGVLEVLAVLG